MSLLATMAKTYGKDRASREKLETRQDHKPMIADLRESGSIEQDADMVILLYRPQVYDSSLDNTSEIIIAKHRHGPTGDVQLAWQGEYTRFMNLAKEQ